MACCQTNKQVKRCNAKKNERVVAPSISADSQLQKSKANTKENITNQRTKELREVTLQLKSEIDGSIQPYIHTNPSTYPLLLIISLSNVH